MLIITVFLLHLKIKAWPYYLDRSICMWYCFFFFFFFFFFFLKRSEYLFHHYWFVSGFVQILIQDVSSSHWAACSRSTEGSETDNFLLHRVSCWALHGLWDKRRAGMIGNNETILIYWRLTLSSKNGLWEIPITHCDWEMVWPAEPSRLFSLI